MVSIVMTTFRKPIFLERALKSVFTQTDSDWELIVVDSSAYEYFELYIRENIQQICTSINKPSEEIFHKIHIIKEHNMDGKTGKLKIRGAKESTVEDYEFVVFFDHDDVLGSTLVENLNYISKNIPGYDLITSDYIQLMYLSETNQLCTTTDLSFLGGSAVKEEKPTWTIYLPFETIKTPSRIYRFTNTTGFKPMYQPKIVSKRVIDNNALLFNEEGRSSDAFLWDITYMMLNRLHINDVQYIYMVYDKGCELNTSCWNRPENYLVEQNAKEANENLMKILERHQYNKFYKTYEPPTKFWKLLDKNNYKTIQDKIQWLKVHDNSPLKTKCADKILIHDYCKEKIGKDLCIPIIQIYNSPDDINFNELPDQFVLKCNHGCGFNIIVTDKSKMNKDEIVSQLKNWLNVNFAYQNGYEMQYANIERKCFAEKYMADISQQDSLLDYKFWCFNGVPKLYTINTGLGHGDILYFNIENDEPMDLYGAFKDKDLSKIFDKPINFDYMKECAIKLSQEFKFVRVDFYEVNGQVYLGELTFTPGSGYFKYQNPEDNYKIGNLLEI